MAAESQGWPYLSASIRLRSRIPDGEGRAIGDDDLNSASLSPAFPAQPHSPSMRETGMDDWIPLGHGNRWSAICLCAVEGVVYVFRNAAEDSRRDVILKGLERGSRYRLEFVDGGKTMTLSGEGLMTRGFSCDLTEPYSSEMIVVRRMGG